MTNTTPTGTTTAPERCPICKKEEHGVVALSNLNLIFKCGIAWSEKRGWYGHCVNASVAALRVGATLEATEQERARQALVEAALAWQAVWGDKYAPTAQPAPMDETDDALWLAAKAYRATLAQE